MHGLWNILSQDKAGYARHPETLRWRGKLATLFARHEALVAEMTRRGYRHQTPLDPTLATGLDGQAEFVDTPERQIILIRTKACSCNV